MKVQQSLLRYLGFNTQGDLGPWTFYTSKRKGLVWFVKAPPTKPPTMLQTHQRNKFRLVGYVWRTLTPEQRADWSTAARRARLSVSGYNLFTYYLIRHDSATVQTVERQSSTDLIPLIKVL